MIRSRKHYHDPHRNGFVTNEQADAWIQRVKGNYPDDICYQEMPEGSGDFYQRYVVCAANRNGDTVVCAPRHGDAIMRAQIRALGFEHGIRGWEQGFIDQWGNWMDREEALIVASRAKQFRRRCGGDDKELFSENLY